MEGADSERDIAALAHTEEQQSGKTTKNNDGENQFGKWQTDFSFDILYQATEVQCS